MESTQRLHLAKYSFLPAQHGKDLWVALGDVESTGLKRT